MEGGPMIWLLNGPRQRLQRINITLDIIRKFRVNGLDMGRESILLNRDEFCTTPHDFFLPDSALDSMGHLLYEFGFTDIYVENFLNVCSMKVSDIVMRNYYKEEVVDIYIEAEEWVDLGENYYDEEYLEAAMEESAPKPVPATTESIQALERLELGDNNIDDYDQCMVCLEELSKSSQMKKLSTVARMPCSHLFHEDCIVQWLNTSHFCPLCRFAMPTAYSNCSVMMSPIS
ncbi:Zinc finger, RING-type [Corchorus olitorius]|uniref:RING-type E3 ubiquitin transferase n=1 Tax=Corchorus olitorius TaxID=93759 RepID=A0A1R3IHY3_9ROSI|nr:Zinc finger, RING-type [Corchorus olitorius]